MKRLGEVLLIGRFEVDLVSIRKLDKSWNIFWMEYEHLGALQRSRSNQHVLDRTGST
ncbi:hypothetical protein L484_019327 [Morus notabilis]|uniref:Uncharacterized protein n=1 Tax=Morus notabilis TaxID=981085 RepID=W9QP23_9ROSA|nr:hypothetical protein L484_019327 [Morus notabilis]